MLIPSEVACRDGGETHRGDDAAAQVGRLADRVHNPLNRMRRQRQQHENGGDVRIPRFFARAIAPSALALLCVPMLAAAQTARPETTVERSYRADANIMLFGLTLISRNDVGGGFARLVETRSGPRNNIRLLFVSGSRPDRAHGLNRMGYIEESVTESNAHPSHAEYLGFMTSSAEESFSDAKKALHGPAAGDAQFVASRGEIDSGGARHTVHHMLLPASSRWTDAPHLLGLVEQDLDHPGNDARYADLRHGEQPETFLYTVLSMVRSPAWTNDGTFLHNGKLFHLHAVKRADERTGQRFVENHLLSSPRNAVELTGLIHNVKTGVDTTFRVWFDRTSPNALPLRFEFQPKSYLRLAFEAVPATDRAVAEAFADRDPHAGSTPISRAALR